MKKTDTNKSLKENLRYSEKANIVFLKLYAKLKKPKNPFDELRSYTLPITKEIKPGADDV